MPVSKSAILLMVIVAFSSGLIASLAIRPAHQAPVKEFDSQNQPNEIRIHWRFPVAFNTNLPAIGSTILYLAKVLKEESDGAIVLEVHEPGNIVPAFAITQAVQEQKVPAGYTWLGYDQGHLPASPLISAVPFGMDPMEFMAWWYNAGGQQLAEEIYHKRGLQPILCGLISPETAGWFRYPIHSLDDLKGLKIRFAGLGGRVLQRLGASVTILPGGEIFPALEKGAIDATEYSLPAVDNQLGFDRLAKYNYFPGWHQPATAFHMVINLKVWKNLALKDQKIMETACTSGVTRSLAEAEAIQGAALEDLARKGVKPSVLSDELISILHQTSLEVLAEEAAKDNEFAKIYQHQKIFRAQYKQWKKLAYLDL